MMPLTTYRYHTEFADYYVECFMTDFAYSKDDATLWLENQGICLTMFGLTADYLRDACRTPSMHNPNLWQLMKNLAYEKFTHDLDNEEEENDE